MMTQVNGSEVKRG